MSENPLAPILDSMEPEEALKAISGALKKLFPLLGDKAFQDFVVNLAGDTGRDKVGSMVHL